MRDPPVAPGIEFRLLADATPEVVATAFAVGFSDYAVPMTLTATQLDARLRSESVDPRASYLLYDLDEPVGLLLIDRRGGNSRIGAMAIAPAIRGCGIGAEVIQRAIIEARARRDTRLVLEVIQTNRRAVRLYERAGFEIVRPLWGFSLHAEPPSAASSPPAREVDPTEGATRVASFGAVDIPWQLQAPSLAAMPPPTRCFVAPSGAIVAMIDTSRQTIRVRALVCHPALDVDEAIAFTRSLRAAFPNRTWTAPPLFTDRERTSFFEPGGWTTTELRQFEMAHALDLSSDESPGAPRLTRNETNRFE